MRLTTRREKLRVYEQRSGGFYRIKEGSAKKIGDKVLGLIEKKDKQQINRLRLSDIEYRKTISAYFKTAEQKTLNKKTEHFFVYTTGERIGFSNDPVTRIETFIDDDPITLKDTPDEPPFEDDEKIIH